MADVTLYLPPTQSQNPNTLALSIPNSEVSFRLVLNAHMCFLMIAASSVTPIALNWANIQFLQVLALSIVSAVVKVLELITKRVFSTFRFSMALWKSTGSTLARNLSFLPLDYSRQVGSILMAS